MILGLGGALLSTLAQSCGAAFSENGQQSAVFAGPCKEPSWLSVKDYQAQSHLTTAAMWRQSDMLSSRRCETATAFLASKGPQL